MCDAVSAITAGLKIATAVQDYRSKKVVAESQKKANEITRKNSDQAYLNDLAKIDAEKVAASREKKAEDFRISQENNKKEAQALNMNAGNGTKIIQDIACHMYLQYLV